MPLTWRDVAGQVQAPDLSDASNSITRGLQLIADAAQQPERRRQAELTRQMDILDRQARDEMEQFQMANMVRQELKADAKEKDIKEFSAAQSFLESGARKAALSGMSFDDFIKTNEVYQRLSEGARAYGASHLSDAYMRGDETRMTMEERAADNARQQAQWKASYELQRQSQADAHADRVAAAEDRRLAREAAAALKPKVWRTGDDKTDRAMTRLGRMTGSNFLEASGAAYEEMSIEEVGKNFKNGEVGAISEVFSDLNRERQVAGKPMLPTGLLKRFIDTNAGKGGFFTGNGMNGINDAKVREMLETQANAFDAAFKGKEFYEELSARIDGGARTTDDDVARAWNSMFPKPKKPAAPPARNNRQAAPAVVGPQWPSIGPTGYN